MFVKPFDHTDTNLAVLNSNGHGVIKTKKTI